jgi:hypothetical protein
VNRPRLPLLVVAVAAPFVVAAITAVVSVLIMPDLGRVITVHWGLAGDADGFAPAWTVLVGFSVITVATPLLVGATLAGLDPRAVTVQLKILTVLPLWLSGFLGVLLLWMFATSADPSAPGPEGGIALALPVGLALAGLGWVLAPAWSREAGVPTGSPAEPLLVGPGERVVWLGAATMSVRSRLVLVLVALFALGAVTITVVATEGGAWPLFVVPVVLAVAFLAATAFSVRVDATGLTVRGVIGIPVLRVPVADIHAVRVIEVNPLADFGGWGLRTGTGRRFGVITSAGEAIEVERNGSRPFVVTVADAETAARLLAAIAASG